MNSNEAAPPSQAEEVKRFEPSPESQMHVRLMEETPTHNLYNVFGGQFKVDKRYIITEPMGQGAYGVVVAAEDVTQLDDSPLRLVAIKKIE